MGHPDKVADQVSDAILDALLTQDPDSRVACETLVTTGLCIVSGEITTNAQIDYQDVVRGVIKRIGYTDDAYGINGDTCAVMITLDRQSPRHQPGGLGRARACTTSRAPATRASCSATPATRRRP